MTIDLDKLNEGLNKLTGRDIERLEREERLTGNKEMEIAFTKSYQIRVAAQALGVNVHDLKDLPAKKYLELCATVLAFFITPESANPKT